MVRPVVCLAMLLLPFLAIGQEFEVVSVKPNKTASNGSSTHSDMGRLTGTNVSLRALIVMAYGLKDYQMEGPEWLRDEHFDIAAKFPEELPNNREKYNAALHSMLQKMLEQRFELVVHRENKMFPVYGLVVAKGGLKVPEVPDSGSHNQNNTNGHYEGTNVSMSSFAEFLARQEDLPVLDMTGLPGVYNFKFDFVPQSRRAADAKGDSALENPGPTIDQVIEEKLGLRLENRKAPIEVVVVDHAEKIPTEN